MDLKIIEFWYLKMVKSLEKLLILSSSKFGGFVIIESILPVHKLGTPIMEINMNKEPIF